MHLNAVQFRRALIHNGCAHIQVKPNDGNLQLVAGGNANGELNIDATSQNGRLKMRSGSTNAFDYSWLNSHMKVDSNNQGLILVGGNSVHTIKVGEGGASAVEIGTTNQQTSFEMASDASAFSFRSNRRVLAL